MSRPVSTRASTAPRSPIMLWRSVEDFQRMFGNEEARAHMKEAEGIAAIEPQLYEVTYTHSI